VIAVNLDIKEILKKNVRIMMEILINYVKEKKDNVMVDIIGGVLRVWIVLNQELIVGKVVKTHVLQKDKRTYSRVIFIYLKTIQQKILNKINIDKNLLLNNFINII
jgi:hypothetical protein